MKINNVAINNWEPPGAPWWENAASKPDEPLIEATIQFTLSHREYHRLLDEDERKAMAAPPVSLEVFATSTFTYTLEDLRKLRACLITNAGKISGALRAFDDGRTGKMDLMAWLEFAEKIKDDRDFPEKHFANGAEWFVHESQP